MNNTFENESWTHEEDVKLGEVMLEVIANGGTVMEGFEKFAATSDERTVIASKFRFFSTVKKMDGYKEKYEEARHKGSKIRKAKGKKVKMAANSNQVQEMLKEDHVVQPEDFLTLAQVFIQQQEEASGKKALAEKDSLIQELKGKVEQLQYKLKQSEIENDELKIQLEDKSAQLSLISQAFGMLNNIKENDTDSINKYKVDQTTGLVTT